MFSMCSELTPRARIPDTRIPQLMQPCTTYRFMISSDKMCTRKKTERILGLLRIQNLKIRKLGGFEEMRFFVFLHYRGQGCISCGILVSGIRARGVSSEHMENMGMFSCSPT